MSGALVLVVGPSGAGKDTLIAAARERLRDDPRFAFPRRLVTRTALAEAEDHESIDHEAFARIRAEGGFALTWGAHGLGYALPRSIEALLAEGRTVVCNVSRRVVGDAMEKYPDSAVVLITAEPALRAARLAVRGREDEAGIAARLAREGAPVPEAVRPAVVDNSGPVAAGVADFVAALTDIAARREAGGEAAR